MGDYIIYVGGYGIRKNVKALLVALSLLKHEENHRIQLVLPGKRHRDFDQLEQLAEALKIGDRVVFPGFLPVEELPYFYGGAELMIYPSMYEGFGLPPLEAMAMGIPVLAAKSSSLPEVLGDAAVYFDPLDSLELAEYIHALLRCEGKRRLMGEQGLARAKEFSWAAKCGGNRSFLASHYGDRRAMIDSLKIREHPILGWMLPNIYEKKFLMRNQITGMRREGSKFMVLQSLIPRIERPELAINIPPTMESSVINSVEITAPKRLAIR